MSLAADMLVNDLKVTHGMLAGAVADLTEAEMYMRPVPGANHPFWQIGHLASAESHMLSKFCGRPAVVSPEWHAKFKNKVTNHEDSPAFFGVSKDELMKQFETVRQSTINFAKSLSDEELKKPTGWDMAPTVGAVIGLNLGHTTMHLGQVQVLRRKLNKPILM